MSVSRGVTTNMLFYFSPTNLVFMFAGTVFHAKRFEVRRDGGRVTLRYVCVTCAKCKCGDFFNCTRQKEYCGEWEHYDFEKSWSAKVRHIKQHLVAHAGLSATKDPTMKDIRSYLQKQFPEEEIPKITRRVVALDLWQHYSQRFP